VARPFDDSGALVLRTKHNAPEGLFESIAHSTAVVGLNTTAELEAGIVGRPVFTISPGEPDGDGQASTMHFHYLTKGRGGFVTAASDLPQHIAQLEDALQAPADPAPIRAFIESFLRPCGFDTPVAPLLAAALERQATIPAAIERATDAAPGGADEVSIRPSEAEALPLALRASRIWVRATADAQRRATGGAIPLNRDTVRWLEQHVSPGDVVYDVNAGIGTYTLIAAKHRGAVVVAFEPAYRAYGELCDNLRLNACEGTVVPLPMPLADVDALAELKYPHQRPGDERYVIRNNAWRVRPTDGTSAYLQPVCLTRLDTAIARYGLPRPKHIRLSSRTAADSVLRGAGELLREPSLETISLAVTHEGEPPVVSQLEACGLQISVRRVLPSQVVQLVAVRS
jgi:FkbM family methyltransferase